jgi:hypothetical protein
VSAWDAGPHTHIPHAIRNAFYHLHFKIRHSLFEEASDTANDEVPARGSRCSSRAFTYGSTFEITGSTTFFRRGYAVLYTRSAGLRTIGRLSAHLVYETVVWYSCAYVGLLMMASCAEEYRAWAVFFTSVTAHRRHSAPFNDRILTSTRIVWWTANGGIAYV